MERFNQFNLFFDKTFSNLFSSGEVEFINNDNTAYNQFIIQSIKSDATPNKAS